MKKIQIKKKIIENNLRTYPDLCEEVLECLDEVRSGLIDKEWVNAIAQYGHYSDSFDIYDAFVLYRINNEIAQGRILYDVINVGSEPCRDKMIKENNDILKNVPHPYIAEFKPTYGAGDNDDGFLSHKEGSKLHTLNRIVNREVEKGKCIMLNLPLELGTTSSFTTFKHAVHGNGVARWAYGSEKIFILVNAYPFSMGGESLIK